MRSGLKTMNRRIASVTKPISGPGTTETERRAQSQSCVGWLLAHGGAGGVEKICQIIFAPTRSTATKDVESTQHKNAGGIGKNILRRTSITVQLSHPGLLNQYESISLNWL